MRIVTWNCRKGLRHSRKISILESLNPDILVLQEAYESDLWMAPIRYWSTNKTVNSNPLGLGVYVFNPEIKVKKLPVSQDYEIIECFSVEHRSLKFTMIPVWCFNKRSVGRFHNKNGMFLHALCHLKNRIGGDTLVLGDFNNGPELKNLTWKNSMDGLKNRGLKRISYGPTHRQKEKLYTVDHVFCGSLLTAKMNPNCAFSRVPSDHIPLSVNLKSQ